MGIYSQLVLFKWTNFKKYLAAKKKLNRLWFLWIIILMANICNQKVENYGKSEWLMINVTQAQMNAPTHTMKTPKRYKEKITTPNFWSGNTFPFNLFHFWFWYILLSHAQILSFLRNRCVTESHFEQSFTIQVFVAWTIYTFSSFECNILMNKLIKCASPSKQQQKYIFTAHMHCL